MRKEIKIYEYKDSSCPYKYIRIYELPQEEQEKFMIFLAKTCRSRPAPEYEKGPCAWVHDYKEFARGADPYEGLKASEAFLKANKSRIKGIIDKK